MMRESRGTLAKKQLVRRFLASVEDHQMDLPLRIDTSGITDVVGCRTGCGCHSLDSAP